MFRISLLIALLASTIAMTPPPTMTQQPGGGPQPPGPPPMAQPAAAPTAAPTTNPAMLARAKDWFGQLQAGKIDRSQLSTKANTSLTDTMVSAAQGEIGSLGAPVTFVQQQAGSQGDISYAVYLLTFKNGKKCNFLFAVDQQGKIEGLQLSHPQ